MVKFYEERVINGLKKWTDVPELWNAKVIERLLVMVWKLYIQYKADSLVNDW